MGFQHLTAEQRSTRARIAALQRWSKEDPSDAARHLRAGFIAKFEREVDPDGVLSAEERSARAGRAMRAHMLILAEKSAAKRKAA